MSNSCNNGVTSPNLMLFVRGHVLSGDPNIGRTYQFPSSPIIIRITIKKIITNACAVTVTLLFPINEPGYVSSDRI